MAIGHVTQDPAISLEFARGASDRSEAAWTRVLYREAQIFHGVDSVFVHVLQNWLADLGDDVPALERSS